MASGFHSGAGILPAASSTAILPCLTPTNHRSPRDTLANHGICPSKTTFKPCQISEYSATFTSTSIQLTQIQCIEKFPKPEK
jgi:hypothetical protein